MAGTVGARTIGCCAHIATALWFLGSHRHQEKHKERLSHQYPLFVDDAATVWPEDDVGSSSESDEDEKAINMIVINF